MLAGGARKNSMTRLVAVPPPWHPLTRKSALQTASEIELTVTGRRSGPDISNPVGSSDSDWYRNVLKAPTIRIAASGAETSAQATPITDPATVNDIVDKFRTKYGAADVDSYYPKRDVAVEIPLA